MRVRFTGEVHSWAPNPREGHEGTMVGRGQRRIRRDSETPEERERLDKEFSDTHALIHWDGNTFAWDCPDSDWEEIKP